MGMIDYETGADSEVFWEAYDVGAEVAETPVKTGEVVTVPMPENYKGTKWEDTYKDGVAKGFYEHNDFVRPVFEFS